MCWFYLENQKNLWESHYRFNREKHDYAKHFYNERRYCLSLKLLLFFLPIKVLFSPCYWKKVGGMAIDSPFQLAEHILKHFFHLF